MYWLAIIHGVAAIYYVQISQKMATYMLFILIVTNLGWIRTNDVDLRHDLLSSIKNFVVH